MLPVDCIYVTTDLTPMQMKAAFELRARKRHVEKGCEVGLAILKGRIDKLPPSKTGVGDHNYTPTRDRSSPTSMAKSGYFN